MSDHDEVLFTRAGTLGRITLNRPRALNALTLPMIEAVAAHLTEWEHDDGVVAVLIDGAGERGLCAGGDIRALYAAVCAGDLSVPEQFFRAEYRLNARIARYAKPYVAFMDGLVMGGGIGISAHGSHRVVTERSRLAMPEVGIGFVPDVGGTWLLGRAPGEFGTHAALTSAQLGAQDAIACGLADTCIASADLDRVRTGLERCEDAEAVRACLAGFAAVPPPGVLQDARAWISACYAHDEVERIVACLDERPEPAARSAAREIVGKSPTSLKVALRALRQARSSPSLERTLELEYRLALAFMRTGDFTEGVRAAVVDKDRNPAWSPATPADVSPALVQAFFSSPDYGGLGLAAR